MHTLQIGALLLPKPSTSLLHPGSQGYLDVLRHGLVPCTHSALLLGLAHHRFDPLNRLLTLMEPASYILREPLNHTLILPPYILVAKAR